MSEPTDPSKPASPDLTGRIGKYEIVSSIGKGAMGKVYKAHDTVLKRDVALKVMAAHIADDEELKARFLREARAVAQMMHPNVVAVFDLGSHTDGSPYIAMELLKGQDLQKAARTSPPLTSERKVQIIVQVLTGLNHAHQAGIVHRDIKPANIFIQQDDTVKIMDFGVAHLTTSASMTGTGSIVGTADYMSPEQVQGQRVDGRSDLFSVGCLLYELITGRRPFHADNLMAIFYKITHDPPNFDLIPAGPENDALLPILKKALARNSDERYQTAYDFAMDLRQWLGAHGTTASTQQVLESLVDLEAPTHAPQPMTEAPGIKTPHADGTVDLQRPGVPRRSTLGPTHVSGRTVVEAPGRPAARPAARPVPPMARRARPVQRRSPMPWVVLGVVAAAAVGGGAYYYFTVLQPQARTPSTLAAAPPPTQAAPPTTAPPTPPPVTAAPQPTFAPPEGKAAASVRAANAAFDRGQYGRAVKNAQNALREDPSNATAQDIFEKAENGQKAVARVQAGGAALARGDFAAAEQEALAAGGLAPSDQSVADLLQRIKTARRAAETQAEQQQAERINELLNEGATALAAKEYDKAIAAYDAVLELDPGHSAARTGQAGASSARAVAEAAAGGAARPPHAFVAGTPVAQPSQIDTGATPPGFGATPEVEVKRGSQAATLPGHLVIEASPPAPQPGDRYTISAYLANEGAQAIKLSQMIVTTTINGDKSQGRVSPRTSLVAPRQTALIFQLRPVWKQGTTSWVMEIVVYTSKSDTYRNTLTWK